MTKELTFAGVKIAPGPARGAVNIYKPKEEDALKFWNSRIQGACRQMGLWSVRSSWHSNHRDLLGGIAYVYTAWETGVWEYEHHIDNGLDPEDWADYCGDGPFRRPGLDLDTAILMHNEREEFSAEEEDYQANLVDFEFLTKHYGSDVVCAWVFDGPSPDDTLKISDEAHARVAAFIGARWQAAYEASQEYSKVRAETIEASEATAA